MTTTKVEVSLTVEKNSDISVDWGDGVVESNIFKHIYTDNIEAHTIVLYGENRALIKLACQNSNLTALDVSKNVTLEELLCYSNNLTTLDISKNVALTSLWCAGNNLTMLDVSKNVVLNFLFCYANPFVSDPDKFTAMANTLVDRTGQETGSLQVFGEVVAEPIRSICNAKNWNIIIS